MVILKAVSKSFDGVELFSNLDFTADAGKKIAITGPSGSGKTTLLNIIGGVEKPDKGEVCIAEKNITQISQKELISIRNQYIGFVFQQHYLLPQLTVWENIVLPFLSDKKNSLPDINYIDYLIEKSGLSSSKNKYPSILSGGESQRVALIRAIVKKPKLILADEPTGSLDYNSANTVTELLLEAINENKATLILVTHSAELAEKMDVTYILKKGLLLINEN